MIENKRTQIIQMTLIKTYKEKNKNSDNQFNPSHPCSINKEV